MIRLTIPEAETFAVPDGSRNMSFRAASAAVVTCYILIGFTDFFNTFLPEYSRREYDIGAYGHIAEGIGQDSAPYPEKR